MYIHLRCDCDFIAFFWNVIGLVGPDASIDMCHFDKSQYPPSFLVNIRFVAASTNHDTTDRMKFSSSSSH